MRPENIDNWSSDTNLKGLAMLLSINDKQVEVGIANIKANKKMIDERLNDDQMKSITNEFVALAGGAGVTLAALAVTGGVSTGIWGGLMTLGLMSTGGMMLGLAAIGGLGYGAYKGIKYFAGTSELEKSGIRLAALESALENNKRAVTYIIDDVNWLTKKTSELFAKLKENEELNNDIMNQIDNFMKVSSCVSDSGKLLNEDTNKDEYEINFAKIPSSLKKAKFDELIISAPNHENIQEYIMSFYEEKTVTNDNGNTKTVYERVNDISYEDAKKIVNILDSIGYYDTKSSVAAQASSLKKKGINFIKDLMG